MRSGCVRGRWVDSTGSGQAGTLGGTQGCGSTWRWVPPSAGSGQASDKLRAGSPGTPGCGSTRPSEDWGPGSPAVRRDDGGTEGGRRGLGAAWDVFRRSGGCVQFWGRCVQFSGECVQFLAECVQFRGGCVHFGGRCVQFLAGRAGWGWGADGRRDSLSRDLRNHTGDVARGRWLVKRAGGAGWGGGLDRGRGWRVLAMTAMPGKQSKLAGMAVAATFQRTGTGGEWLVTCRENWEVELLMLRGLRVAIWSTGV